MQTTKTANKDEMVEADCTASSESMDKVRQKNIRLYKNLGLPKENEEDWRYTNVERLKLNSFEEQLNNDINDGIENHISITKLPEIFEEKGVVFCSINDAFEKHRSLIQKYFFSSIKESKDKFTAMNSAHFSSGIFL